MAGAFEGLAFDWLITLGHILVLRGWALRSITSPDHITTEWRVQAGRLGQPIIFSLLRHSSQPRACSTHKAPGSTLGPMASSSRPPRCSVSASAAHVRTAGRQQCGSTSLAWRQRGEEEEEERFISEPGVHCLSQSWFLPAVRWQCPFRSPKCPGGTKGIRSPSLPIPPHGMWGFLCPGSKCLQASISSSIKWG